MRLFIGVQLPDSLRSRFTRLQSLLRPAADDVRWVPAGNAHVTLRFVGDTEPERVPGLRSALCDAAGTTPACTVELAGCGTFPHRGRVRALWVGVRDPAPLAAIVAGIDGRLEAAGWPGRRRAWQPHLTLGRPRRGCRANLRAVAAAHADHSLGPLPVEAFELIRSHLSADGARYECLETFPLAR